MPCVQFISQQFDLPEFVAKSVYERLSDEHIDHLAVTFDHYCDRQTEILDTDFAEEIHALLDIINASCGKTSAAVMALMLRLLDTHAANRFVNERPKFRLTIWRSIDRNIECTLKEDMPEVSFIQSTFESGKAWLTRCKN